MKLPNTIHYQNQTSINFFVEKRLVYQRSTESGPETEYNEPLLNHIITLNTPRRGYDTRARITKNFFNRNKTQGQTLQTYLESLITDVPNAPNIPNNIHNSGVLTRFIAELQFAIDLPMQDNASGIDGILGQRTIDKINTIKERARTLEETQSARRSLSQDALASTPEGETAISETAQQQSDLADSELEPTRGHLDQQDVLSSTGTRAREALTTRSHENRESEIREYSQAVLQQDINFLRDSNNQVATTPQWFNDTLLNHRGGRGRARRQDRRAQRRNIGTLRRIITQEEISNHHILSTHLGVLGIPFTINSIENLFDTEAGTISANTILQQSRVVLNNEQSIARIQEQIRTLEESSEGTEDTTATQINSLQIMLSRLEQKQDAISSFDKLLDSLQELSPSDSSYLELSNIVQSIRIILGAVSNMEQVEPRIINSDYVSTCNVSSDINSEFQSLTTNVHTNEFEQSWASQFGHENIISLESSHYSPRWERDQLTLLAVMVKVYGNINTLKSLGLVSNINQEGEVQIKSLGEYAELIAIINSRYGHHIFSRDSNRGTDNLTEAISNLNNDRYFPQIQRTIYEYKTVQTANASPREQQSLQVATVLDQLFPNRHSGGVTEKRGVETSLEASDIDGAEVTGLTRAGIHDLEHSYADPSLEQYLLSQLSTYEQGSIIYSIEALNLKLKELILLGRTMVFTEPNLPPNYGQGVASSSFSIFRDNTNILRELTTEEITLIRLGLRGQIEHINNRRTRESRSLEQQQIDQHDQAIDDLLNSLDLSPEERRHVKNEIFRLTLSMFADQGDLHPALALSFDIVKNENHQLTVTLGADISDMVQDPNSAAVYFGRIGYSWSPLDELLTLSAYTSTFSAGASATVSFPIANNHSLSLSGGGGFSYAAFLPYWMVNAGWQRRDITQSVDRQISNAISSRFEESVTPQMIDIIANGQASNEQILNSVNDEVFTELFSTLPDNFFESPEELEDFKIYIITSYCKAVINYGVENVRGGLTDFGIGLINGIPTISFGFISRTGESLIHYSADFTNQNLSAEQQLLLQNDLESQFSNLPPNTQVALESRSGIITYDGETGRREVILDNAIAELPLMPTIEDTVNTLNNTEQDTGLYFRSATESEQSIHQNLQFVFQINDLVDSQSLSIRNNRTFNLYIDPTSGMQLVPLSNSEYGILFNNESGLPPVPFGITRSEILTPIGSSDTQVDISFTNSPTTTQAIITNPLMYEYITTPPATTVLTRTNNDYPTIQSYQRQLSQNIDYPRSIINLTSEELEASSHLLTALSSSVGHSPERLSPTPEMNALAEQLLNDRSFMEDFARHTLTGISPNQSYNPSVFAQLIQDRLRTPEYSQFSTTNIPADRLLMYLESVLIPGTYRQLRETSGLSNRVRVINDVTERVVGSYLNSFLSDPRFAQYYNEQGELVSFTNEDQAAIRNTLITQNLLDINSTEAEILQQIESLQELSSISTLGLGTTTLTTAGNRNIQNSQGLRHMRVTPDSPINIFNTREIDPNSITARFLKTIIEPPFPTGNLNQLNASNLQQILDSDTALKFLSFQYSYNGTNISILSLMYDQSGVELLTNIYQNLHNSDNLNEILTRIQRDPNSEEYKLISHFLNFIRSIQSHSTHQGEIQLHQYDGSITEGQGRLLGSMNIQSVAGTTFIDVCGNLTMYYDERYSLTLNHEVIPPQVVAASRQSMYDALQTERSARVVGFGAAGAIRLGRPSSPEPEPEPDPDPELPTPIIPPTTGELVGKPGEAGEADT